MTRRQHTPARRQQPRIAALVARGWSEPGAQFLADRLTTIELARLAAPTPTRSPAPRSTYRKTPIRPALRWAVFRRDSYRCQSCGTDVDLTADHVIPEVLGGPTELDNLQALCRPCNSRKGTR